MIVEERIYTLHPGKTPDFLAVYEEGRELQTSVLGNMIGFFQTEIGPLNQVVHMWGYKDLLDRAERRQRLMAQPEWPPFTRKLFPFILTMENKILLPTPFSPIR